MVITNKTNVDVYFSGHCLKPNESRKRYESAFDTLGIHSEIGSVEIITVYGKRHINNYGKLVGKEGWKKEAGMKNIIIENV